MGKPRNAALLVRISDDRAGEAAGVARQEKDGRALADRLGWAVTEVLVENDTSAFKRRTVRLPDGTTSERVFRPAFRRLLDQIQSGEVDGLIAYHLDRVARDPRDLEDLIDVVEQTHIPVESVTGSLRLSTDADITMARIGVAIANQSSRDASRRIRRKHEELAESGRYGGGGARRYGYESDGMTIRETEAVVLREAASRVLAGESVSAICRDLDARGIKPVKAASWSGKSLADQLRGPRVAGLRVHRGEVAGTAAWEPILDREQWEAVCAALASRADGRRQPTLQRWLNGLLFCSQCGAGLTGNRIREGAFRYWCDTARGKGCGGIAINGPGAEREIESQVCEYLTRPDLVSRLRASASGENAAEIRKEIDDDDAQLRELSRMWAQKAITLSEFAEARKVIAERIESNRATLGRSLPSAARKAMSAADPGEAFRSLSAVEKRDTARAVLSLGGFVGWTVLPADLSKPRRFDPDRLELREG